MIVHKYVSCFRLSKVESVITGWIEKSTPQRMGAPMPLLFFILLLLSACGPKPIERQSPLDTAENQYRRGLTSLERGDVIGAQRAFERARMLDAEYPGIYVGYALVAMQRGDFFRAHKELELALHKDNDFIDALIAQGRLRTRQGTTRGENPKKWLPDALRAYKKAEDKAPDYPPIHYYRGQSYLDAQNLPLARQAFTRLIEVNRGPLVHQAMQKVEQIQMVERAAPGTSVGIKIGLADQISRAELAVLLLEELKIDVLIQKRGTDRGESSFRSPDHQSGSVPIAADIDHSWAKPWIEEILALGVPGLELFPDQTFQPNQPLTRANYAMVNQGVLVLLSGDRTLPTRYIGEPSRFPDVRGDFYAYNAIALSTERGFMSADKRTGQFYPERNVSGAEALLTIRELQNSFRMEF